MNSESMLAHVGVIVLIVTLATWSAFEFCRARWRVPAVPRAGALLVLVGLAVAVLFLVLDLVLAHGWLGLVSAETASESKDLLHSHLLWAVALVSATCVTVGLVLQTREAARLIERLARSESELNDEIKSHKASTEERIRAEEALRHRDEELGEALWAVPVPVFFADVGTSQFLYGNKAALSLFGLAEQEFPSYRASTFLTLPSAGDGTPGSVEGEHAGLELTTPVDTAGAPPRIVAANIRRITFLGHDAALVTITDLGERVAATEAARESEARYRNIFDFVPSPIFLHNGERIIQANPAAAELYGYDSSEEMVGLPILSMVHPDDHPQFHERLASIRAEKKALPIVEDRRIRKDGQEIIVEQTGQLFEIGGETLILAVNRDITARRHAEEMLRQSQKMEALGQLTGGVAHDFNNLLAVIVGNVGLLRRRADFSASWERYLKEIESAVRRGADLTSRLLAFARKHPLSPEVVDVNALVSENAEMLQRTLGEAVTLRTIRGAGLWKVRADRSQVETALLNLTLNARDAMPDGGRLTIELSNAEISGAYADSAPDVAPGRYVVLAVTDTGIGISEELQSRIFEPFFSTKQAGKGTGLGLSMVFGFAQQSGGHLTVYSEPGEGTTFRLYLPKADDDWVNTEVPAPSDTAIELAGLNVLVVEDDEDLRGVIVAMLEEAGIFTAGAADANAAMDVVRELDRVDILVTDVILPGEKNGAKLAAELTNLQPDVKVLYMSGYTENAILHNGQLDEGVRLLSKPFDQKSLIAALRNLQAESR